MYVKWYLVSYQDLTIPDEWLPVTQLGGAKELIAAFHAAHSQPDPPKAETGVPEVDAPVKSASEAQVVSKDDEHGSSSAVTVTKVSTIVSKGVAQPPTIEERVTSLLAPYLHLRNDAPFKEEVEKALQDSARDKIHEYHPVGDGQHLGNGGTMFPGVLLLKEERLIAAGALHGPKSCHCWCFAHPNWEQRSLPCSYS